MEIIICGLSQHDYNICLSVLGQAWEYEQLRSWEYEIEWIRQNAQWVYAG